MLSDPKMVLECDTPGCQYTDEIGLTPTARGWDDRNVRREIERLGWVEVGQYEHKCPDCVEREKGDQDAN